MEQRELAKVRNIQKNILEDLIKDIESILTLLGSKEEIEQSYVSRLTKASEAMLKISEMKSDAQGKRIFSALLKFTKKRMFIERPQTLVDYLKLIKEYFKKV